MIDRFLRAFPLFLCLLAVPAVCGCGGASAARRTDAFPAGKPSVQTVSPPAVFVDDSSTAAGPGGAPAETVPTPTASPASAPSADAALPLAAGTAVAPKNGPAVPAAPAEQAAGPAQPTASARVSAALAQGPGSYTEPVAESWQPLLERLKKDPKVRPEMLRYFNGLPEYSPAPMGVKIKELFTSAFLRKKPVDDGTPKPPPSRIYRNVVTADTVRKCNDFLSRNKDIFDAVEKKYPVPREILVALLFVETRLGTYVGKDNALWSLASMAAADTPERMAGGMGGIPITNAHKDWLQARLTDKSRWAYTELCALLDYCDTYNLDPSRIPGSAYGAIGICQFMPSNIVPYGEDGSGSGVINLFSEADAIFSAARYLSKHGWGTGMSVDRQRSVIKRYNNLNIYANTILALGESVRTGVLQAGPPDMAVKVAAAPKKKAAAAKKTAAAPQARTKKKTASSGKETAK